LSHGESLPETHVSRKGLNPASARRVIVFDDLAMLMWPWNARAMLGIALQSADDVRSGTNLNLRAPSAAYKGRHIATNSLPPFVAF
jgi:hypothetical protein